MDVIFIELLGDQLENPNYLQRLGNSEKQREILLH